MLHSPASPSISTSPRDIHHTRRPPRTFTPAPEGEGLSMFGPDDDGGHWFEQSGHMTVAGFDERTFCYRQSQRFETRAAAWDACRRRAIRWSPWERNGDILEWPKGGA
jgi:hypothetical protein